MFIREKAGAGLWHFIGMAIGISGLLLLLVSLIKAGFGQTPIVHHLTDFLGQQIPLLGWLLDRLPNTTEVDILSVLLSTPGIGAIVLIGIGFSITYSTRKSFTIIGKASETRRLRELLGDDASSHQSIGDITGNGQVHINQTAEWQRKNLPQKTSWKRPASVAVGVIVVVVGAIVTKTMGLTP